MSRPALAGLICLALLELATVLRALVLKHLDPALALARILALAIVRGSLAGTFAGAAIDAEAASRDALDRKRGRNQCGA
jgi:hypothetical protein